MQGRNLFRLTTGLSIEVALGAGAATFYSGAVLHLGPLVYAYAAVTFFAVLSIYNLDHYLDARRALANGAVSHAVRRTGHTSHPRVLGAVAIIAALSAGGTAVLFLPLRALAAGLFMSTLMASYFLYAHRATRPRFKEAAVALGYTGGVWLPEAAGSPALFASVASAGTPWSVPSGLDIHSSLLALGLFILAALTNVYVHAVIDYSDDVAAHQASLATSVGLSKARFVLPALGLVLLVLVLYLAAAHPRVPSGNLLIWTPVVVALCQWCMLFLGHDSRVGYWIGEGAFSLFAAALLVQLPSGPG